MTTRLESLHALWMRESGLTLPKWSFSIMHRWETLLHECGPLDIEIEEALSLVIARIKRESAKFSGYYAHLSFYKITDCARFTEHLSYALAERRQPKPGPPIVRQDWRKPQKQEPVARKADEIIASKGFKDLMRLRDEL